MESLGAAKAKNGRLSRGTPVLSQYGSTPSPPPPTHTQTRGVAGNIKGFSACTHLNMAHLFPGVHSDLSWISNSSLVVRALASGSGGPGSIPEAGKETFRRPNMGQTES